MQLAISCVQQGKNGFPERLKQLYDPPKQLYVTGNLNSLLKGPVLAVVGSRAVSPYGRQVTEQFVQAAAKAGVTIVSGLALGVDSIAHHNALQASGKTIAVLPTGLGRIYPASHQQLAEQIVTGAGCLVSEYKDPLAPMKHQFIARNRLIAGLSDAVLITEAAERSGSLHTAQFALESGKDVLVVPGNVTSHGSAGVNNLLKAGATPVTSAKDLLDYFGVNSSQRQFIGANQAEQTIIELLQQGYSNAEELYKRSQLTPAEFNQNLTMLEINRVIKPLGANYWSLV